MFTHQSPYASMDNNPILNVDPDGSFSRIGAWWRDIAWGGDGISKNNKTGEWGVNYNYTNAAGETVASVISNGGKPQTQQDARELVAERWDNIKFGQETKTITQNEQGDFIRTTDGKSIYEQPSASTRGKMLLNAIEPAVATSSPVDIAKLTTSVSKGILPNSGPIIRSVGAGSRAEMLAKKLKMNINSATTRQVLNSLDESVETFISTYRKSSIRSEIPGKFFNQTVEEALKSGNTTIRKLLTDGRFVK